MAIQSSPIKLEQRTLPGQPAQFSLPRVDENYFEKLAAFGLACLAAAIVGKLTMALLTPKYDKDVYQTPSIK